MAKLAGIPESLLERAREKLRELEEERPAVSVNRSEASNSDAGGQISFFEADQSSPQSDPEANPALEKLRSLNLMEITPSQAIKILEELKESIDD